MSGPTTTITTDPVTPTSPASDPASTPAAPTPTTDPAGDVVPMTPATRQFAIRVAVVALCAVLIIIVATFSALVLILHDGATTQSVVAHLTNMGYGIVGALIVIVGGPHILAAIVTAIKGSGAA